MKSRYYTIKPNPKMMEDLQAMLTDGANRVFITGYDLEIVDTCIVDHRTRRDSSANRSIVKPLLLDGNGYYHYACPNCGTVHALHASFERAVIDPPCPGKRNNRQFLTNNGALLTVKGDKIALDISAMNRGDDK